MKGIAVTSAAAAAAACCLVASSVSASLPPSSRAFGISSSVLAKNHAFAGLNSRGGAVGKLGIVLSFSCCWMTVTTLRILSRWKLVTIGLNVNNPDLPIATHTA